MTENANVIERAVAYTAVVLARRGIIDEARGRRIADLAWPRVVTGLSRTSQRTFDVAMVGIAVGPAAIAGMGFAFVYWLIVNGLGFSLGNGAMTLLSQRFGADDEAGFDVALKQAMWVEILMAVGFMSVFVAFAPRLIALMGADPEVIEHGATYLTLIGVALLFELPTKIWSRSLVSADDAWTPMIVRAGGAVANIVLNAILIFGFGLGVFGAGLGTLIATAATFLVLLVGFVNGRLPGLGAFPVRLRVGPPYFAASVMKQLLEISAPLMGKRLVSRASRFAMFAIVAQFGTVVVAAYTVSRRARSLLNTPAWGFGAAARSLVGQQLGDGDEAEAEAYGWDALRFMLVVYAVFSVLAFAFAGQIASLFTDDPATVRETVPLIRVVAISLVGLGLDSACSGTLSAGGDTNWPLYGRLVGMYVFMIPVAYLGVVTPLGIFLLYVAIVLEMVVPGSIVFWRFRTGAWKVISRQYRPADTE